MRTSLPTHWTLIPSRPRTGASRSRLDDSDCHGYRARTGRWRNCRCQDQDRLRIRQAVGDRKALPCISIALNAFDANPRISSISALFISTAQSVVTSRFNRALSNCRRRSIASSEKPVSPFSRWSSRRLSPNRVSAASIGDDTSFPYRPSDNHKRFCSSMLLSSCRDDNTRSMYILLCAFHSNQLGSNRKSRSGMWAASDVLGTILP